MTDYDIIIIGSGPAGLEAAITAKIRKKNILLLGQKDLSTKLTKAHTINNWLGMPGISGDELSKAFQKHLEEQNIEITEKRAGMIYNMGDFFAVQCGPDMYKAHSIILATGVVNSKSFPGEDELLGKGVSYCATCDAALYSGKTAIVISYNKNEEKEADFLSEYAEKVIYIPMYNEMPSLNNNIEIQKVNPLEIKNDDSGVILKTDKENLNADGIFILRDSVAPSTLLPELEIDKAHVITDKKMATNVAGVFACGDITGQPYQYIKAAGEGNIAALSAASYIDEKLK